MQASLQIGTSTNCLNYVLACLFPASHLRLLQQRQTLSMMTINSRTAMMMLDE